MDVFSAIGLAITVVICGPVISSSLGSLRRAEDSRKDRN
jgi:hypothetical protein